MSTDEELKSFVTQESERIRAVADSIIDEFVGLIGGYIAERVKCSIDGNTFTSWRSTPATEPCASLLEAVREETASRGEASGSEENVIREISHPSVFPLHSLLWFPPQRCHSDFHRLQRCDSSLRGPFSEAENSAVTAGRGGSER